MLILYSSHSFFPFLNFGFKLNCSGLFFDCGAIDLLSVRRS